ncbi:MAG: TetR/AcrR family transcriptional regulator [Lachnospiraceae bacterium]|nr:TetR/AcrR family transcriptional regulator [Lachnospiraceae bacterium]
MERDKMRSALMESVIHIVAQEGLENTTTKKIAQRVGVNEVYIHRTCRDKEDLMKRAFLAEDQEFLQEILRQFSILKAEEASLETKGRAVWTSCWDYLMNRPDSCLFYVRYFYSANFNEAVQKKHRLLCQPLLEHLRSEAETEKISETFLFQILEMSWLFSSKVALGIWKNSQETAEECFHLLYSMCQAVPGLTRTPGGTAGI